MESGSVTRGYIDRIFAERGIRIRPEIELGSLDMIVEFARHGLGVGATVREFVAAELAAGTLHELRTDTPIPPRAIGLIRLQDVGLSLASQAFINYLDWGAHHN